ncbi:hypothetical protein [Yoonia sp. SDW83-1]|uniref:hypothetical protein n=1 Tax=Yoonia sp. SDW83-1 TaxID=3366945 RepID=UPI00398C2C0C
MRFLILFLLWASPVVAERELHVIGVYERHNDIRDRPELGPVPVIVDRPDADVTLLLTNYEPVFWDVTLTPGTRIERVLLGGYEPDRSQVTLNGIPYPGVDIVTLRHSYTRDNIKFRAIVMAAPELGGFVRPSSFEGSYEAPRDGFVIDAVQTDPELGPDYLADVLAPLDVVPVSLQPRLTDPARPGPTVRFENDGVTLTLEDGDATFFPIPPDLPRISWGADAIYVPDRNTIYAVTIGGDGFLYDINVRTGAWRLAANMQGYDAQGLIYDDALDRLIMTGGGFMPPSIRIYDPDGESFTEVPLAGAALIGLTDIYDRANERPPALRPIGIAGDMVLLRASPDAFRFRGPGDPPYRIWLVDLTTGTGQLVGYSAAQPTCPEGSGCKPENRD